MIFNAIRAAILRVQGVAIQQAFSSTDLVALEMADLANEVAADIVASHDWRALTKVATVVGNGGLAYPLPADYDRMTLASEVDDAATWFWGYDNFESVNEWMRFKSGTYSIVSPGGWIIIGGELQFYPAPNGTAQYPYVSNLWARAADGTPKAEFTADDDTFVLDERLLTLGLIWKWNAQKGQDYSEALSDYEMALGQKQGRDKGSRLLRTPRRYGVPGARLAYAGRPLG